MIFTRITFVGETHWARMLCDELNEHYPERVRCRYVPSSQRRRWGGKLRMLLFSDIIVRVGMPPNLLRKHERLWVFLGRHRPRRLATFIYWIGTDVMRVCQRVAEASLSERDLAAVRGWQNITGVQRLTDELGSIGIAATTVPFPGLVLDMPEEVHPMPADMTVLSYVPDERREFYDLPSLIAAARALPDVRFVIVGGDGTGLENIPANMTFLGFVRDMVPVYQSASCVVRLVAHDGAGMSVAEGLLAARPVIYSYRLPHAIHVPYQDETALIAALRALHEQHLAGGILPNTAGREWAVHEFDQGPRLARFIEVLLADERTGTGRMTDRQRH